MAYVAANLYFHDGYPGRGASYTYKSDTDTRATVMTAGYFNNSDDDLNLTADDTIVVIGDQGGYILRVDSISSGSVSTEVSGTPIWVSCKITDVSTADSSWMVSPCDGIISRIKTVLYGTISGADAAVGLEIGGTDVTGGQVTIAYSGSAAGDVDESAATAANTVSEGTAIEVDTDGASTGTVEVGVFVEILPV